MTTNTKLPAIQFYPGDWRKDPGIIALDLSHRGLWFEVLLLMHESPERGVLLTGTGKPMPVPMLANMFREDPTRVEGMLEVLIEYGVASRRESDGAVINRRMMRDAEHHKATKAARSEAGKKGAESRWHGKEWQNDSKRIARKKPVPSSEMTNDASSSSSSSSTSVVDTVAAPLVPSHGSPPNSKRAKALPKVTWEPNAGFVCCPERCKQWAKAFARIDILHELAKAHAWYLDNPRKRKKDHTRFLGAWMSRADERMANASTTRERPNDRQGMASDTLERMKTKALRQD